MKILISVDIEGVAGVYHAEQVRAGNPEYERARRLMTQEANAAVEGAFAACSFWYVECLARAGQVEKAHLEFEQLLRYANPLGLYAEEFDSQARHLGNTPQALSHLALISAATFLDRKLSGEKTVWQP